MIFDALYFSLQTLHDDAYKFAKGGIIRHPLGFDMKLRQPLDFYAVTDHGFFMGMMPAWADPETKPENILMLKFFIMLIEKRI